MTKKKKPTIKSEEAARLHKQKTLRPITQEEYNDYQELLQTLSPVEKPPFFLLALNTVGVLSSTIILGFVFNTPCFVKQKSA